MTEQRIPKIGEAVKVVLSDYTETYGLITAVHGPGFGEGEDFTPPIVNLVYVVDDPSKSDSYGRQIGRDMTSVYHVKQTKNMPKPGRYYDFLV